jgi:glycerophosphoryl diester phosphodiesterase
MLETRRQITGKVSLVGHRGASACAPENTLASFREALRQGADIIELDVQLCADGQVVVFHDDHLERTTDGHGVLAEWSLAELKALDAGSWFAPRFAGERIPTLEEALAWARWRVPLFIELKHGGHTQPSLDTVVVQRILAHEMAEQVMIISFDHQALCRVNGLTPHLATGALYRTHVDDPVALARGIGANAVMPFWQAVTAEDVVLCHAAGLAVQVWGTDLDYPTLIAAGADCVNADHPAQVRHDFLEGGNG